VTRVRDAPGFRELVRMPRAQHDVGRNGCDPVGGDCVDELMGRPIPRRVVPVDPGEATRQTQDRLAIFQRVALDAQADGLPRRCQASESARPAMPGENILDAGGDGAGMGDPHAATITPRSIQRSRRVDC
jgi:hypothetical protein